MNRGLRKSSIPNEVIDSIANEMKKKFYPANQIMKMAKDKCGYNGGFSTLLNAIEHSGYCVMEENANTKKGWKVQYKVAIDKDYR